MDSPSCQIHKKRSPNKCYRLQFQQQTAKSLDFSHLPVQRSGGIYLKMSVKKVEIGKRAVEHGVLATIRKSAHISTPVHSAHKFISTWAWHI